LECTCKAYDILKKVNGSVKQTIIARSTMESELVALEMVG